MAESDSDEDNYVFMGTAMREEVSTSRAVVGGRQVGESQQGMSYVKTLPLWKQEAVDDQGRRRFHGAFTGGYSAGYFNTVGSKEGFEPATFRSSRSERSASNKQTVQDFLDADELEEMGKTQIETQSQYDTFGFCAVAKAQRVLSEDKAERPQIIPGPLIQEFAAFSSDSWGVKMLQLMGWRQGRGIGMARSVRDTGDSRWGTIVGVGVDNTPVFKLAAKRNRYGMGFDPYKNAEEFRTLKKGGGPDNDTQKCTKRRGVAFGTGVLEEFDTYGEEEDYVTELVDTKHASFQEVMSEDEDDVHSFSRYRGRERLAGPSSAKAMIGTAHDAMKTSHSVIRGFTAAESSGIKATHYQPPAVPVGFQEIHRFLSSLPLQCSIPDLPKGTKVPPPADPEAKHAADTLAVFVAKNGELFEELARKRQAGRSSFSFLHGGEGAAYYAWRVRTLRAASSSVPAEQPLSSSLPPSARTAAERMRVLGEEPLPRASASGQTPDTVTPSAIPTRSPRTIESSVAPGDKQFLISALQGKFVSAAKQEMQGLTVPEQSSSSALHFASSGTIQQPLVLSGGLVSKTEIASAFGGQAGSRDHGANVTELQPTRSVEDWWPEPLLCKRFGVPDPNKGKEKPEKSTASRFMTDHLSLPETASILAASEAEAAVPVGAFVAAAHAQALKPVDAADMADAFLQNLFEPSTATISNAKADDNNGVHKQPVNSADSEPLSRASVSLASTISEQQRFVSKPIDIFKAVFEDSSSEEDGVLNTSTRNLEGRPPPPVSVPDGKRPLEPNSLGNALLQASYRDKGKQQAATASQKEAPRAPFLPAPRSRERLDPEQPPQPQARTQTQKDSEVLQILDALRSVKKRKRTEEPKRKRKHKDKHSKSKKSGKGEKKKRSKHESKRNSTRTKKDRHRRSPSSDDSSSSEQSPSN